MRRSIVRLSAVVALGSWMLSAGLCALVGLHVQTEHHAHAGEAAHDHATDAWHASGHDDHDHPLVEADDDAPRAPRADVDAPAPAGRPAAWLASAGVRAPLPAPAAPLRAPPRTTTPLRI